MSKSLPVFLTVALSPLTLLTTPIRFPRLTLARQKRRYNARGAELSALKVRDDGPAIGSVMPEIAAETVNGQGVFSSLGLASSGARSILAFLSPLCESCHGATEALNSLASSAEGGILPAIVLRSDRSTCRAFCKLFQMTLPVVCDLGAQITRSLDIHHTPLLLLYGADGRLERKGVATNGSELHALVTGYRAPGTWVDEIYPPVADEKRSTLPPK